MYSRILKFRKKKNNCECRTIFLDFERPDGPGPDVKLANVLQAPEAASGHRYAVAEITVLGEIPDRDTQLYFELKSSWRFAAVTNCDFRRPEPLA